MSGNLFLWRNNLFLWRDALPHDVICVI